MCTDTWYRPLLTCDQTMRFAAQSDCIQLWQRYTKRWWSIVWLKFMKKSECSQFLKGIGALYDAFSQQKGNLQG